MKLARAVYELTEKFPKREIYGLSSQMRRSSVSIPSNIAEGYGRKSTKEYKRFYLIAYGSALELETQIILAKDLNFCKTSDFYQIENLLEEVLKMLNSMTKKPKY